MVTPTIFYDRQLFERAIDLYLEECYEARRPVRGQDFAARVALTPQHANVLAKQLLGKPLVGYLRAKQVHYAADLLRRTPLSVDEIARRAGFGTRSSFYRVFVKVMATTPAAFRT